MIRNYFHNFNSSKIVSLSSSKERLKYSLRSYLFVLRRLCNSYNVSLKAFRGSRLVNDKVNTEDRFSG